MRHLKSAVLILALAPALTGCVIAIDADEWDDDHRWSSGWEARQHRNHEYIDNLMLGESIGNIRADLGAPDFTHRFRGDGATSKDETTPLVFVGGELVGWGESAIDKATSRKRDTRIGDSETGCGHPRSVDLRADREPSLRVSAALDPVPPGPLRQPRTQGLRERRG